MDANQPKPFPNLRFNDEQGTAHKLSEEKSKLTLVHFWATWCAPCVKEFPQIDALQQAYGDKGLKILAISLDGERNLKKVTAFYAAHAITHLKVYMDDGTATNAANLIGMPTTFFINSDGMNIGTAMGPVNWESPETKGFIEKSLK